MGFALWIDNGLAWAEGTHEYRPMGAAVVAATTQFVARDFRADRRRRRRDDPGFEGFFGSLVEVNAYLSRVRGGRRTPLPAAGRALPFF